MATTTVAGLRTTGASGSGASALGQPPNDLRLLGDMLLIRRFEERCVALYQAEMIRGFLHLSIGEEAVAVGIMRALTPDDAVVSTHRDHGHALARGIDPGAVMAEMFGVVEGCSRGRGGSMHLFDAAARFYGGSAIVGSCLPVAVGLGLADRYLGKDRVTAVVFGEGALAEGEFHESMNLAALWRLPVVFCCENNGYAMGTSLHRTHASPDLVGRAASYGVPARSVDGMDVRAVLQAVAAARASIMDTGGARFLELRTYRYRAHSMFDPELYRTKEEVERWKQRDPIAALRRALEAAGELTAAGWDDMERGVAEEIEAAVEFALSGTLEPVAELHRFVHTEPAS